MTNRRPGRPSGATHPTITVANIDTGALVTWNDGVFVGPRNAVETATRVADAHLTVDVGHGIPPVKAAPDTPAGALAAMLATAPGRTILASPLDQPIPGWPEPVDCLTTPAREA